MLESQQDDQPQEQVLPRLPTGPAAVSEPATSSARITEQVLQSLSKSGAPPSSAPITGNSLLREELGLDSLRTIDLVLDLEDAFGVSIEADELEVVRSVGDVVRLIESKVAARST
jgi:acyl carrier protein